MDYGRDEDFGWEAQARRSAAQQRRPARSESVFGLIWRAVVGAGRPSRTTIAMMVGAGLGLALIVAPSLREVVVGVYQRVTGVITERPDFVIRRIAVTGAGHVSDAELVEALGLTGGPVQSFDFDAFAARDRLEKLGWVARAEVRATPPQRVEVAIAERRPIALWRRGGRLALIDMKGFVIADDLDLTAGRYGGADPKLLLRLPLLVGEGAAKAAREGAMLDRAALDGGLKVVGWTRVGDRRWDVELLDGGRLKLPEKDPGAALGLFLHWAEATDLREHGFSYYDFRDPTKPHGGFSS